MTSHPQQILLSLCLIATSTTCLTAANWSADFDSPLPASWTTAGITQPPGGSSATFSATIESGVLRLSDPTPANAGGSFVAFGGAAADFFSDVKVGADINVTQDTNDDLGVLARANLATGNGYLGSVDFDDGTACITKVQNFSTGVDLGCTADGALATSASYYIELSATGVADLKLDVFDMAGGTLLQSVSALDDGSSLGAAYASGVSGVKIVPKGVTLSDAMAEPINGTFDNVFSATIPEPTAGSLLLMAILSLGLLRRPTAG